MPTLPQPLTRARRRLLAGGTVLVGLACAPLLSACGDSGRVAAEPAPTETTRILAPAATDAAAAPRGPREAPGARAEDRIAPGAASADAGTSSADGGASSADAGASSADRGTTSPEPSGSAADGDAAPPAAAMPSEHERIDAPAPAASASLPRQTVHVTRATALRASPGGRVLARLAPRTEFDSPTVLPVLRAQDGWLEVRSVALPNGRTGWISARAALEWHGNRWRVDVSLGRREVVVRRGGREVSRFSVAIGSRSTPTPTGRFAVTDKLTTGSPTSPYGCCILALSGRQTQTPQGWGGGDRLAIHGTNLPETIGTRASLGCLRAPEDAIRRAVRTVPLGTIVTIRA